MFRTRRASLFTFPIWSLLFAWLFFGCLELAELAYAAPEAAVEEQAEQDLDQEALAQLASGLKPDILSLDVPCVQDLAEAAELPLGFSTCPRYSRVLRWGHGPPSLRLHQQLSVYRI